MKQNVFSIKVSERLRELSVEGETEMYWKHLTQSPDGPIDRWVLADDAPKYETPNFLPAYQLHDILRLMPAIGEKMGWTLMQKVSSRMEICTAFFNDDYEGAEQYLLGILKQ